MRFNHLEAVIFDWAGTTVDYGSFAPLQVFLDIFSEEGIAVTEEEARKPMGMLKKDHIRTILEMPRIQNLWLEKKGRKASVIDIDVLHDRFEPLLMERLPEYTDPISGVTETVSKLKKAGISIGSTTGYTEKMMDIVTKEASKKGYAPDVYVTPDMVSGKGRPWPYMIYRNMELLGVSAVWRTVKFGDTIADMQEGYHAGCWTVGIVEGSSLMGVSKQDYETLDPEKKAKLFKKTTEEYYQAGADYVIGQFSEIPQLLTNINNKIAEKQRLGGLGGKDNF